jgi:hypothetical protein
MKTQLTVRPADSTYVEAVTRWVIGTNDRDLAAPDGSWDLVVLKQDGTTSLLLTGQTTRAVPLHFTPGDEIVTISFKASTFLSAIPPPTMLNRALLLPSTRTQFRLGSNIFEIPTFENAEAFAQALIHKGHLYRDAVVEGLLLNHPPPYSLRSLQRRFLQTTGMTHSFYRQIQRARQAATLLQHGKPAIDVAHTVGYADQSHMTRSLKRILGQTPAEIATKQRI